MRIEEIESRYMELFWEQQRCQWENYADDAHHDLNAIDEQIFVLLSPHQNRAWGDSRQEKVMHAICKRAFVDCHPEISWLRNKLDDQDNYTGAFRHLRKSNPVRFRQLLGESMKEDVLELLRRRQSMARSVGFASYPELVLWSEDLSLEQVRTLLRNQIKQSLPAAKTLAKHYGITWSSWHERLASIGSLSGFRDPLNLISTILEGLGLGSLKRGISVLAKDQSIFGYAGILSVPDDIRILVRPVDNLNQELTLYHELGHTVAHALNEEKGVFTTWTIAYDEAMAVLFERIATSIFLSDAQRKAAQDLSILETTRCATSALFELALWEDPAAAEELFQEHYGAWGIGPPHAGTWAADTFRSVDPVYIHNFVIGARVADRTIEFLQAEFGTHYAEWGQWLAENYYRDGRCRSLTEKTAKVDGFE